MGSKLRLLLLGIAVAGAFVLVVTRLPHSPQELRAAVPVDGVALLAIVLVGWTLLTPTLVSGSLLAVTSGLLLGTAVGTPVSILGATLGGSLAFLLARGLGHQAVERLAGRRLRAVQERLARRGFLAVFLTRISPAPATLMHYAAGLSQIRPRHFVAGLALGGVPRLFAYTAIGGSGGDVTSGPALVALGVLSALTVGGALLAWRRRRRVSVAT